MIVSVAYDKDWHCADCLATWGVDVVPQVLAVLATDSYCREPRYQPGSWGVGFALRLHGSVFPRAFAPQLQLKLQQDIQEHKRIVVLASF